FNKKIPPSIFRYKKSHTPGRNKACKFLKVFKVGHAVCCIIRPREQEVNYTFNTFYTIKWQILMLLKSHHADVLLLHAPIQIINPQQQLMYKAF
ncbi:hypothetical protein, partial [Bacillus cabrialesii]|uniref:hypothetical protein n=1 Tax=Bacillus cabrialesii TaxID=2487276 RepID=UPI003CEF742B